jgi:hypothetical protein
MAPHISCMQEPQASMSGSTCTPSVPLDTVLQLLTATDSKTLVLRHIAALEAVARKNSAGFYLSDLELVCSIMDVTIRAIKRGELQFVSALCLMLRCGIRDGVCASFYPSCASEDASVSMQNLGASTPEKGCHRRNNNERSCAPHA